MGVTETKVSLMAYLIGASVPFLAGLLVKIYFRFRKRNRFEYESSYSIEKARRRYHYQSLKPSGSAANELLVVKAEECGGFDHQVAGHFAEVLKKYKYMVLKPMHKRDLFLRELKFYELFADSVPYMHQFPYEYISKYYGVILCKNSVGKQIPCIALDDATRSFRRPCVIDIKMGRQTFEPTASLEKKLREKIKYKYQEMFGFRVTGFKVYDSVVERYKEIKKNFGRSLTPAIVKHGLASFFYNGTSVRLDVIRSVIQHLEKILEWAIEQKSWSLYCSSILIVYDAEYYLSQNVSTPIRYQGSAAVDQRHFLERCIDEYDAVQAQLPPLVERQPSLDNYPIPTQRSSSSQMRVEDAMEKMDECSCRYKPEFVDFSTAKKRRDYKVPKGFYRSCCSNEGVVVRIIDHAHSVPSDEPDVSYAYGVRMLISVLREIENDVQWRRHWEPCLDLAPALRAGFIN